jgi:hypothetical protein
MGMMITEALAEIKTLHKRIGKKADNVNKYLVRLENVLDPLADDGGSAEFVKKNKQGHDDLVERIVKIRTGIQRVNNTTTLEVAGKTRTIAEWLTWRKECVQFLRSLNGGMISQIDSGKSQVEKSRRENEQAKDWALAVNYSEAELAKEAEHIEEIMGELDGQLSLINAVTKIEVNKLERE